MRLRVLSATGALVVAAMASMFATTIGPIHHWAFDEAGGSAAVDSVGGLTGTLGASVQRIPGVVGSGALRFPATGAVDSAVDFTNGAGQFGTADFTVSLWFRTTDLRNQELIGNRNDASHGNFFCVRVNGGNIYFEVDEDGGGTNYAFAGAFGAYADGGWHRVYARRNGAHVSMVVDGVLFDGSTAAAPANINNFSSLIAGFSPGVQGSYNTALAGDLDDLRIYDRALTDAETLTPVDGDNDGVADAGDVCPATPAGAVVNASGCSIPQLVPCAGPWKNHGDYVSSVTKATNEFAAAGLITNAQRGAIVSAAAKSSCGK